MTFPLWVSPSPAVHRVNLHGGSPSGSKGKMQGRVHLKRHSRLNAKLLDFNKAYVHLFILARS